MVRVGYRCVHMIIINGILGKMGGKEIHCVHKLWTDYKAQQEALINHYVFWEVNMPSSSPSSLECEYGESSCLVYSSIEGFLQESFDQRHLLI